MKIRCTRTIIQKITQTVLAGALALGGASCAPDMSGYYYDQFGNPISTGTSPSLGGGNYNLGSAGTISAVRMGGYGPSYTESRTIKANSRLRVRVTPGVNDQNILSSTGTLTGYSYSYSKLSVKIQIGNQIYDTAALSNGVASAVTSYTVDLSNDLWSTPSCAKQAGATCRNDFTVTISQPLYDYCPFQNRYGCALTPPMASHPWNVRVQFETDDTGSL